MNARNRFQTASKSVWHARVNTPKDMAQKATSLTFPDKPKNLKIGDELNRGAWGTVYNGELEGRPVAVKQIHELLHQGGGEEERRKLFADFREECKKLQSLSHPHVVGKWNLRGINYSYLELPTPLSHGHRDPGYIRVLAFTRAH